LLTSLPQKRHLVEELGVDAVLAITFTRAFARTPPETFVQKLCDAADRLREICVGQGWNFGANRAGGVALLTSLARRLGFQLNAVPSVLIDGKVVSSTSIRVAVQRGDLKGAARLLGRSFYRQIAYNFAWAQEMAEMEHRATDAGDPFDVVFEPGACAHS
jgi:riboflavin kinase/FMN adenylyltransferase